MPSRNVNFVKKAQVLMCQFEDCWHNKNGRIVHEAEIISNIKPEIGKIRPVVIIYPHKRARLAAVIPFTTKKPVKEILNALRIPAGVMPGVLGRSECWALCDMPETVSLDRLRTVFAGTRDSYHRRFNQAASVLPPEYFQQIIARFAKLFSA